MNNPKEKHCPKCGAKMYKRFNSTVWVCPICLNKKNKEILSKSIQKSKSKPAKQVIGKKKSPKAKAMKDADDWFSRYIRIKHRISIETDGTVICRCYTCGAIKEAKKIQNGHFQRRGYKTTRFHINDARPQCLQCNYFRSGEFEKFEINLIKEIGEEEVSKLKSLAQEIGEDNEMFFREQSDKYKSLVNKMVKSLGIKIWW